LLLILFQDQRIIYFVVHPPTISSGAGAHHALSPLNNTLK